MMEENFPDLLSQLCKLDQEEALTKERIFALTHLLDDQHEFLQHLYDTQSHIKVTLRCLCDASSMPGSQRDEDDDS